MNTQHNEMTMDEMDQVSGGPHIKNFNGARLFVTYTEHGSPFQVEIHSPKQRPVPSANPYQRPIWK
jgi:hypothetical protein